MDANWWKAVQKIHTATSGQEILWALTGSVGMVLQGMPLQPHDVDLQTDLEGAYAIAGLFSKYVTKPVHERRSEKMRSYFGILEIEGMVVEIMGEVQKRLPDGTWEPAVDVEKHRRWITVNGLSLPVLSLEYEAKAYRMMGRIEKADLLDRWVQEHSESNGSNES